LGFANTIRFLLAKNQTMGWSLFSFNVGLEAGQIIVVLCILLLSFLAVDKFKLKRKWWVWALSGVAFCVALKMVWHRMPLSS
jgi:HupE / UreJ protein